VFAEIEKGRNPWAWEIEKDSEEAEEFRKGLEEFNHTDPYCAIELLIVPPEKTHLNRTTLSTKRNPSAKRSPAPAIVETPASGSNSSRRTDLQSSIFTNSATPLPASADKSEPRPAPTSGPGRTPPSSRGADPAECAKPAPPSRAKTACPICGKVLGRPNDMQRHMRSVHADESARPFQCEKCAKRFTLSQYLITHRREVHEGMRKFPCGHCGHSFARRYDRESHEGKMHGKEE